MTTAEIIAALEAMARASEDSARCCRAAAAVHKAEWDEVCAVAPSQATYATRARAQALYPHVIGNEREAERLEAEAVLLCEAVEKLRETCAQ